MRQFLWYSGSDYFLPLSEKSACGRIESFGLILLAEKISRQPIIDFVMWLLVITLTQLYKVKEQAEQKEIPNVQFEERGGTRKFHVGAKACA